MIKNLVRKIIKLKKINKMLKMIIKVLKQKEKVIIKWMEIFKFKIKKVFTI